MMMVMMVPTTLMTMMSLRPPCSVHSQQPAASVVAAAVGLVALASLGGVAPTTDCSDMCLVPDSAIGDQVCDDVANNCMCGWDGGDCCDADADMSFCTVCECLHTTTQTVTTTPNVTLQPSTTSDAPVACQDGKSLYSKDDIRNWTDVWGYTCWEYFLYDWCEEYGTNHADPMGRTAAEACCGCGGGNLDNEWPVTTTPPCTGTYYEWEAVMSRSMYEYLLQPASEDGSSGDFVVTTSGSSSVAEPSANVSISCSDLRDSHCYSQYIITLEGTGGLTPKEACCVCGASYVVGALYPRIRRPPR